MSCSAHEAEIDKDALQRLLDARVLSFSGLRCPFCGDADLFVHAPGTGHWSGRRTWWTIGCDSRKCNSCWTLNEDTYEGAWMKIRHAQNESSGGTAKTDSDPTTDAPGVASRALFGNEVFSLELIKRATAPAWKDCPTGTVAYSHTGTNWTKQEDGWWRANGGDSFPTPGGCACLVRLTNAPGNPPP